MRVVTYKNGARRVLEATLAERMAYFTDKGPGLDDCWIWTGSFNRKNYGAIKIGGKGHRAHRVAYELVNGPIPPGMVIDHLCRNHACVRPDHLEVVTYQQNALRGETIPARWAARTECPKGHPFDESNTGYRKGTRARVCWACARERGRVQRRLP